MSSLPLAVCVDLKLALAFSIGISEKQPAFLVYRVAGVWPGLQGFLPPPWLCDPRAPGPRK